MLAKDALSSADLTAVRNRSKSPTHVRILLSSIVHVVKVPHGAHEGGFESVLGRKSKFTQLNQGAYGKHSPKVLPFMFLCVWQA